VDGNDVQRRVAQKVLTAAALSIPVLSVVKDDRHRPDRLLGPASLIAKFRDDILLANAEAHRFALAFHQTRRRNRIRKL
jgi:excinuclease UvrABC nuclease subunit